MTYYLKKGYFWVLNGQGVGKGRIFGNRNALDQLVMRVGASKLERRRSNYEFDAHRKVPFLYIQLLLDGELNGQYFEF